MTRTETPWAPRWHAATALVAITALVLQLVLVIIGNPILDEVEPPGLGLRLYRFFSYFTIQSNVLVALAAFTLARAPQRDGSGWRVLRLAGLVGITVTGIVHFLLLRPLLDLQGWDYAADKLLHLAVPALAIVGWVAFGPRGRVTARVVALALVWPLAWLAWTLTVGGLSGWYPYPFLDHREDGWGAVAATCVAIVALAGALMWAALAADRRLPTSSQPVGPGAR